MSRKNTQNRRYQRNQTHVYTLPDEMITEISEAFEYYDKDNKKEISMLNFRNILQNFGFWKMNKKDLEDFLKNTSIDTSRRTVTYQDVLDVITSRWSTAGREEEAKECFKIFDKKQKGIINHNDIKTVLLNFIDEIDQEDINEFINEIDPNTSGTISFESFNKFYS